MMDTKEIIMNMARVSDELRGMMVATTPQDKEEGSRKVQDLVTTFASEIIDLQKEVEVLKGVNKYKEDKDADSN